ncbi:hypothetical protein CALCODRAFT_486861 [Calocera cornea HHB12733]|uniref:Uncharacterized protein n=1 Tax=Calocera cornea HHB12733 TaxID=1353952 RepID=A0A165DHH7_9BASI|nr:hypothetical protein CALCODRAFT_486861 [Calocera cornea HHB12733]
MESVLSSLAGANSQSPSSPDSDGSLADCVDAADKLTGVWKKPAPALNDSAGSKPKLPILADPSALKGKLKNTEIVEGKIVVSREEQVLLKRIFAEMLAKKGSATAPLTAVEFEELLVVVDGAVKIAPNNPRHAAGDPDEIDDDDDDETDLPQQQDHAPAAQRQGQQAPETKDAQAHRLEDAQAPEDRQQDTPADSTSAVHPIIARCMEEKVVKLDPVTARSTEMAGEGVRWRHLGQTVGWFEEEARQELHNARVEAGLRRKSDRALEAEYQTGRKQGAQAYKDIHPRTLKQRVRDAKGMASYRVGKVKGWLATHPKEAAKMVRRAATIVVKCLWENGDKIVTTLIALALMIARFMAS